MLASRPAQAGKITRLQLIAPGIVVAAISLVAGAHPIAQGAKSNVSLDVRTSFHPGGQIGGDADDGSGTYLHKETGNRSQIETGTGDFMFQLNLYSHKGARRTAFVDLAWPADGISAPFGRHQSSDFFMSIDRLYQMAEGETKQTTGAVRFRHSNGQQYWIRFDGKLGSLIQVERVSPTAWKITSVPGSVGELTILNNGKISYTHVGVYALAFGIDVTLM